METRGIARAIEYARNHMDVAVYRLRDLRGQMPKHMPACFALELVPFTIGLPVANEQRAFDRLGEASLRTERPVQRLSVYATHALYGASTRQTATRAIETSCLNQPITLGARHDLC